MTGPQKVYVRATFIILGKSNRLGCLQTVSIWKQYSRLVLRFGGAAGGGGVRGGNYF